MNVFVRFIFCVLSGVFFSVVAEVLLSCFFTVFYMKKYDVDSVVDLQNDYGFGLLGFLVFLVSFVFFIFLFSYVSWRVSAKFFKGDEK